MLRHSRTEMLKKRPSAPLSPSRAAKASEETPQNFNRAVDVLKAQSLLKPDDSDTKSVRSATSNLTARRVKKRENT